MYSYDSAEILLDQINKHIKAKGLKVYIYTYAEGFENDEDENDPHNGEPEYDIRLATMDEDGVEDEDLFCTDSYCIIDCCVEEILEELVSRGLIEKGKHLEAA